MTAAPIEARAAFDRIRYAQVWEDADVLTAAMGEVAGRRLVSICSAGDNALALLTLDPAEVIAVDLSEAQLACLRFRVAAIRVLDHAAFLELMGSRGSARRAELLARVLAELSPADRSFWAAQAGAVVRHGAAGIGRFEGYFRIFRRFLLPLVHARRTVARVFEPREPEARARFLEEEFLTWRWRLLVRFFFSRRVMGLLGRDPAFFDHVEGSVSDHVLARCRHAGIVTDPAENPYLHWILTGTHGRALPMPWREEHHAAIRSRLDRLTLHRGPLERLDATGIAGFNLSDIFEYMAPEVLPDVYGSLLAMAAPGARLVYWNMMAPRRRPESLAHRLVRLKEVEDRLKPRDKAFFYSDFVVEEVR
ncbi:MAG: BtaA family protein [Rhodobacteraceae bacterium]|nr:BtaA family protein [Paracoccaceae bacterium]